MLEALKTAARRVAAALEPPPLSDGERAEVLSFLSELDAAGGVLLDDEERADAAVVTLAIARGYVSGGGAWGPGTEITAKGRRLLAATYPTRVLVHVDHKVGFPG